MRNLVIGQRQKAPNFSAFHWSPHGCLITIGQHFVTTRVVHLPKRTETSLITESDQSRANHQVLQLYTVRTAWSDSDQAVRAVHSCKSWLYSQFNMFKVYEYTSTFLHHFFQRRTTFITSGLPYGRQNISKMDPSLDGFFPTIREFFPLKVDPNFEGRQEW